ncbi:hypothetical protein KIN20_031862 [Parelaphostrongylus tenuis]|uniref:Uncharacterized protein n=1 Tax=Parelaphostrongylus tenuis TaxID=148309 RepID=A0AAD5WHL3_PARTN|nr:hypothetical protein KIN20_031862 [Parelaphostrongylus tenuis]
MNILPFIARLSTDPFMIFLLAIIPIVLGCGVTPAGQASSRPFTVTGFSLPVAMAHAGSTEVSSQVPGIARDKGGAQAFVQRLVMLTVFDILEHQGRSALLPDAVILAILSQLAFNVTYEPLPCENVALNLAADMRLESFSSSSAI